MATVRYTVVHGEVIAEKRSNVRREYVPDPLGSTIALLDNNQAITDTFTYFPYGEEYNRTGTTPTALRFVGTVGYYSDSSTRAYVRARQLSFESGRWTSEDPIGFSGGDWNLYRYTSGNPTTFIDPSGRRQVDNRDPKCKYDLKDLTPDVKKCALEKCKIDPSKPADYINCVKKCAKGDLKDKIVDMLCFMVACVQYGGTDPCKDPDCKKVDEDCSACSHHKLTQCLCKSKKLEDPTKCWTEHQKREAKCGGLPSLPD